MFFTKLLRSGILFLTACNDELVAKPVILGILPSTSVILELKSAFLTKPLTLGFFYQHHLFSFQSLIYPYHM